MTLSPKAVYCCLVCGKFFQGRGKGTPFYQHSLETEHRVGLNLHTLSCYRMPEGDSIDDPTLEDIRYNLRPTFTPRDIAFFSEKSPTEVPMVRDLHGNRYFPGLIGMNDSNGTDCFTAVIQCLVRVQKLRDYFLTRRDVWQESQSIVVRSFGELVCQMFSSRRFKSSLSAHELIQAISSASSKKFQIGERKDASQFVAWLLFELHKGSGGGKKKNSSFIHECFQGEIRVETTVIELKREYEEDKVGKTSRLGPATSSSFAEPTAPQTRQSDHVGTFTKAQVVTNTVERVPFLFLSLDLPTNPLFKEESQGETVIPKTTLLQILEKYDGVTTREITLPGGRIEQKRYRVTKLPPYLVLHLKRFAKNMQFDMVEKNRAVVSLPVANLDMTPYLEPHTENQNASQNSFNLIANVCHDGGVGPGVKNAIADGSYRANVYYHPRDSWHEIKDLSIKQTMPQLVSVSETYLAVYEHSQ